MIAERRKWIYDYVMDGNPPPRNLDQFNKEREAKIASKDEEDSSSSPDKNKKKKAGGGNKKNKEKGGDKKKKKKKGDKKKKKGKAEIVPPPSLNGPDVSQGQRLVVEGLTEAYSSFETKWSDNVDGDDSINLDLIKDNVRGEIEENIREQVIIVLS